MPFTDPGALRLPFLRPAVALLTCLALAAGGVSPAAAADMQPPGYIVTEPVPEAPASPGFDWSRCYTGVQFGSQRVMKHEELGQSAGPKPYFWNLILKDYVTNPDGPTFGSQIGCNYASPGGALIGVESEFWYSPSDDKDCMTRIEPTAVCMENRKRFNGSLTLRGGYVWDERILTYVKAGILLTETGFYNVSNTYGLQETPTGGYEFQKDQHAMWWASGWARNVAPTIGFGIEYALGQHWTIRGEAAVSYVQQYDTDITVTKVSNVHWDSVKNGGPPPAIGDKLGVKAKELITNFKIGMNYMF